MQPIEPKRLLQAARTSVALVTLVHETIWSLFPDELVALTENPEQELLDLLQTAMNRATGPPDHRNPSSP
jgi:hypothetical protein